MGRVLLNDPPRLRPLRGIRNFRPTRGCTRSAGRTKFNVVANLTVSKWARNEDTCGQWIFVTGTDATGCQKQWRRKLLWRAYRLRVRPIMSFLRIADYFTLLEARDNRFCRSYIDYFINYPIDIL